MQYKGHIVTGLISGGIISAVSQGLGFDLSVEEYLVGVLAGSLLPDIDTPKSLIGLFTLPISALIYLIFGHRGITHSLFAATGLGLMMWGTDSSLAFGLLVGYLTHLLMDSFTPMGVPWLYPIGRVRD